MSKTKGPIDSILDELGTQRDEIELQIGLAKGEVKKQWSVLEGRFEELKIKADNAGDIASDTAENVSEALEMAAEELRSGFEKLKKLI